jgi:hypothetical protein
MGGVKELGSASKGGGRRASGGWIRWVATKIQDLHELRHQPRSWWRRQDPASGHVSNRATLRLQYAWIFFMSRGFVSHLFHVPDDMSQFVWDPYLLQTRDPNSDLFMIYTFPLVHEADLSIILYMLPRVHIVFLEIPDNMFHEAKN